MRPVVLSAALLLIAAAGTASADPRPTTRPQGVGTVCLDTLGTLIPPSCQSFIGSRLRVDPDICRCPGTGVREASIPYCETGETPTPESLDAARARTAAYQARGTLVGASFNGKRMCLERGRTGG